MQSCCNDVYYCYSTKVHIFCFDGAVWAFEEVVQYQIT